MTEAVTGTMAERARRWLGTPYRHQASLKGEGADCLGLVRGLWREVVGPEPEAVPPYSPDWAQTGGEEILLAALRRWMVEIAPEAAAVGDVLVFRMAGGAPARHCGVLSRGGLTRGAGEARMIHAYWGRAVVESWLGSWWRARVAAAFAWPCGAMTREEA